MNSMVDELHERAVNYMIMEFTWNSGVITPEALDFTRLSPWNVTYIFIYRGLA